MTSITLVALGTVPAFYQLGKDDNSRGLIMDVVFQFINQRNRSGNVSFAYGNIIDIVGVIVFNCLFISVVTSMINRRIALYENGRLRYSLNRHYTIIGYNKLTVSLMRFLHKKNHSAYMLLMTSQTVSSIRKTLEAELTEEEMKHVILYSGNQVISEDIKTLQPEKCLEMYIMGDDSDVCDTLNMECLNVVYSVLKKDKATRRLRCYVVFVKAEIYASFQYADITPDIKNYISFVPFTFEDVWAQKVLVQNYVGAPIDSPIGISKDSDKHVHVIINGMTPMGIAIALQTARLAHFPNINTDEISTLTHITFIDPDACRKMKEFKHHYSSLFDLSYSLYWNGKVARNGKWHNPIFENEDTKYLSPNFIDVCWEFIEADISDANVCTYIKDLAKETRAFLSIFNCKRDCEQNLIDAINLPDIVYYSDSVIQIYVQQINSSSIINMLSSTPNSKFKKLRSFGMFDETFQADLMSEHYAKMINAKYYGINDMSKQEEIDQVWDRLSVANKWSNINNANMCFFRLRSIGYDNNVTINDLQNLIDTHISEMMQVEHNRWNIDKLLSGYRALTEPESNKARRDVDEKKRLKLPPNYAHLDICSFELLKQIDHEACHYDVDVLKIIPEIVFNK